MMKKRLVIGISGASGAPLAIELLKELRLHSEWESHLIVTRGGAETIRMETGLGMDKLKNLADCYYENENIGAPVASGTFRCEGMVVIPCSMKTAAGIHSGYSDNLLLRAADVMLKERRRLVLVARETPMSQIHLRNLYELSQAGAIIFPAMLTYYNRPKKVEDMTRHVVCKVLDMWNIEAAGFCRWPGADMDTSG